MDFQFYLLAILLRLEIFSQHQDEIELAIIDYTMKEMSGKTLALELLECKPSLKVILTSGYTSVSMAEFPEGKTYFLQKPFAPPELLSLINSLLNK